ncbi:hypothetical protein [Brevundimonas aurantiaca]|uniref:hypothetical protein n=1 Tax=Brevundimonas aurantiaca TaxID=74316 RepID=UPI00279526DD|nr:hypothetical protein [Brevundimonas aurantiaca]
MLFVQPVPDRRIQVEIETGQDDAAQGRSGHGAQDVGGGGDGAGRTGGDDGLGRGRVVPQFGEAAQKRGAAPGWIDQAQFGEAFGPGLDRQAQEFGRAFPVFGHFAVDQGRDPSGVRNLFQLAGIEEAAERIRQIQGPHRRQAVVELLDDHPRHLEPAGQGGDGGRQVEAEGAGGEGGLVLLQIAQRPDLGQQDGAALGEFRQGAGEGAGGAAVGQKEGGVRQGLGRQIAQPGQDAGGQVFEEGPVGGDGVPAGAGRREGVEGAHSNPASFASA